MYHKSFFAYGTEEPSSYTQDWVEAVGSLGAPNHTLTSLEDAPTTPSSFDGDEDEIVRSMYAAIAPLEPGPGDKWQHPDYAAMFPHVPGFMNDAATTLYSTSPVPSPASSATLLNSPFAFLAESALPWGGDVPLDQPAAFSTAAPQHFGSTFQPEPTPTTPAFDPSSLAFLQRTFCNSSLAYDQGQYGPGQQPSQHGIGAADAVAPGLIMGMEVNMDAAALTSMHPISFSPPLVSFSEPQQEFVVTGQLQLTTTTRNNQPLLGIKAEPTVPQGSNDEVAESPKKKRKQSTEKRYACSYPGCTASAYSVFSHFPLPFQS